MPLYGPKWPLKSGKEDTYELNTNLRDQVNYNLKCILLTSPGENISSPGYGVGLRFYLFESNNVYTRNQIVKRIRNQVSTYVPDINLIDVVIESDAADIDQNSLSIKIYYRLNDEKVEFELTMANTTQTGYS
tara:strand:+ start:220 stop:615 length:396 start_codon:yes stop_codon:yes gene_type:complete